jgi:hypothetical protein
VALVSSQYVHHTVTSQGYETNFTSVYSKKGNIVQASYHAAFKVVTFCSYGSVKCFANGKVMTSVTKNQIGFNEVQKLKNMHA